MINQYLLDNLRCPLDPSKSAVKLQNDYLECERCALRFMIRDGFPDMVVEEAILPTGCESIAQLPCQRVDTSEPPA
jgi:uncharacterized protein YbaR (Trm112 family)